MSMRLAARTPESARAVRSPREARVPRTNTQPASTSSCPGGEEPPPRCSGKAEKRLCGGAGEHQLQSQSIRVRGEDRPPGHQGDASAHCGASPHPTEFGFSPLSGVLSREVVESPSLEIFKTHLDKVLYSLL